MAGRSRVVSPAVWACAVVCLLLQTAAHTLGDVLSCWSTGCAPSSCDWSPAVHRALAALAPLRRRRLQRGVAAVERVAARLERVWWRLWAPVLATVERWRRAST